MQHETSLLRLTSPHLLLTLTTFLLIPILAGCSSIPRSGPRMPVIVGSWWQIAGNPDLGELTGPEPDNPNGRQEPVDFGIWQARDGSWQLWSCIRHTRCGGNSRLFHAWQAQKLTDTNWTPQGVAMQAEPAYGETVGGMQAPHVVPIDDVYHMFYGDWNHICLARSEDGKKFERWVYPAGHTGMFDEGPDANARDAMVLRVGDEWYCYYTAFPNRVGAVYLRRSKDLRTWSASKVVSRGGLTSDAWYSAECPHVVKVGDYYYLFRTQRYAKPPTTSVYRSKDPTDFGVDEHADEHFVCLLPVAAPEVVIHDNQHYIAALLPDIQGIRLARLKWIPDPAE